MEPTQENDKLVIGRIALQANNHQTYGGTATVNGKHSNNIELTFKNHNNGDEFTVTSKGNHGLFYFLGDQDTYYELTKIFFKVTEANNSWASVWFYPHDLIHVASKAGVYNAGSLSWVSDDENEIDRNELKQAKFPSNIEDIIRSEYPDSLWLQKAWFDTELMQDLNVYSKLIMWYPNNPEYAYAYNESAWNYVTSQDNLKIDPEKALPLALKAVELTNRDKFEYLDTLAAVYARLGQFDKAIGAQEEAISKSMSKGKTSQTEKYKKVLSDYRKGKIHY